MDSARSSSGLVLVTGASGFIGSHLAERLLAAGCPLRLLVRDPARLAPSLAAAEIVRGDLRDAASLRAAIRGVQTVFHLAGNVHTWDRRAEYWADNVDGVAHLLNAIRAEGVPLPRLVHLSSVDVYGFPATPCSEDCPTRSQGFGYGDSKIAGEERIHQAMQDWGLPAVILRPSNVMGRRSPFIERVGKELHSGLMLTLQGGEVDAGFLDVEHLLDVLLWAAAEPSALGEIFNVNGPESISWRRFLHDLRHGVSGRGWIVNLPFPVADFFSRMLAFPYQTLRLRQEPLLHPLIVHIFGRTCGHSAAKLRRFGAPQARRDYAEVMADAIAWYRESAQ